MKTNKKTTSSIVNAIGTLVLAAAVCLSVPVTTSAASAKKSSTSAAKSSKVTSRVTSRVNSKVSTKDATEAKFAPQIAAAKKLTSKLTATQRTKLLALLNSGESEELVKISGIGTTRARAIAAARPFENVENVTLIAGIGDLTLTKIIAHSKAAK